jgi:hypothetical protein
LHAETLNVWPYTIGTFKITFEKIHPHKLNEIVNISKEEVQDSDCLNNIFLTIGI